MVKREGRGAAQPDSAAEALERQTRITNALFGLGQRLAAVRDPATVPPAITSAVREATGASFALVGRWNEGRTRLSFPAVDGFGAEQLRLLMQMDATPARFGFIRGGLAGRSNVRVRPFDPDDLPAEVVESLGLTAVAGAPIIVDGEPWGVVGVGTAPGDPDIVETGAELLVGFATIAATALSRAEAVAALAAQAEALESSIAERTTRLREVVDELRLANQAKVEFLANVSHELRTPLTAILGYSDLLLRGVDGPLTPEQLEDVATIDRSGRHLLELIDDLIDISRIEAGRVELHRQRVDLEKLLGETVEQIRPLAGEKGLSLRLLTLDLPTTVSADPERLRDILINLLSNAVKFTPSGGNVRVNAGAEADGSIRIEVADTGIGISPEHIERVFDKFHRASGPEHAGTGLGLSIAREFARLHGGDLIVDSTLGLGSRFTIVLPPMPRQATRRPEPEPIARA